MNGEKPLLSVSNLTGGYGNAQVLHGVSLEVAKGNIVAIIGRNGVGKSTLLKCIMGIAQVRSGRIFFEGEELIGLPTWSIARRGLAWVPEERRIFSSITVRENLCIGVRNDREEEILAKVLAVFPWLEGYLDRKGSQLSGGEQQMLAIGRALAMEPKLILVDEPSEGLAPIVVEAIRETIGSLRNAASFVLVEQNLSFVKGLADYVYIMSKGEVVASGRAEEVLLDSVLLDRYLLPSS